MEQIEITDRAASQIARGSLWVFSNEIHKKPATIVPGIWCQFHCRSKIVATGYANPHSLIFGRVAALGAHNNISSVLESRLKNAFACRAHLGPSQAARLIYSEADFLPGLILDVYSDHLVLQSNTAGIDMALPELEKLVPTVFETVFGRQPKGFVVKADSGIRRLEGIVDFTKIIIGKEDAMRVVQFEEEGTHFAADLIEGQKTGFFLDQRDNRTFLFNFIAKQPSKRVLDLCCYSGGWGLRAMTAGASNVTFVDESKHALELVLKNIELNQIQKSKYQLANSDVFQFLEKSEELYDIIVADPPAFVKSKKNLPQAINAYEKLNRLAWRRLKVGGLLVSCSCSYHVGDEDFLALLQSAIGKEKGFAHVIYRGSQAVDHPVLLSMPETRYLKCVALQKINVLSN